MDREEGMEILRNGEWLSATPAEFQEAILSRCEWGHLEAGALIQQGGEDEGELIGLAHGIIEMRTILGRADTPIMHFAHAVFWFGFAPVIYGRCRPLAASARTSIWIARVPRPALTALLAARPEGWRHFVQPLLLYGNTTVTIAADLLIRDSERRCGAVLLRLGGRRLAGPEDAASTQVPITQRELAGATNLSLNSAGTMVQRLKARGLIDLGYREITIRAPDALRAFVDQE